MPKEISAQPTYRFQQNPSGKTTVSTMQDGIDPAALAESLRSGTLELLEKDKTHIENSTKKLATLSTLEAQIRNFQLVNKTLANISKQSSIFQNAVTTVGNVNGAPGSDFLAVSTAYSAPFLNQNYDVQVKQLAKRDILASGKTFADLTTAASFDKSLFLNGTEIEIDASDSLTAIIQKINAQKDITGVEASSALISTEIGYVLKLSSTTVATPIDLHGSDAEHFADSGFKFTSAADFSGSAEKLAHKKTLQSAISVDGITYYRDTNVLNDVIDGLTFTLKGKMDTSAQLSFKPDSDQIIERVNTWVQTVNNIKTALKEHMVEANKDVTLYGERIIVDTLQMLGQIARGAKGIPIGSRYGSEFSRFEFTPIDKDSFGGDLRYDAGKLTTMVNRDPIGFAKIMGNYCEHVNDGLTILDFPENLSDDFVAKDMTLVITKKLSGEYETTLTCGDISETVETPQLGIVSFKSAFKGISFQHTKGVETTETTTLKFTQGVASLMHASLNKYLLDGDYKGPLAQTKKSITQNREDLAQKVENARDKAQREYDKSIQSLMKWTVASENAKRSLKLLEGLRGGKRND